MATLDPDSARFMAANRLHWDELVPVHAASAFYDVGAFKAGATTLHDIELRELGDVSGRTMLHLQCHFGLDTLSWRRAGATVTGVDFSGEAITLARQLSADTGLDARFIEANIYDLPGVLHETFDVVFASYGVICWLPDLDRWAAVAAHFVVPGGVLYLVDDHPSAGLLTEGADGSLAVDDGHARRPQPERSDNEGSYADRNARIKTPNFEWTHSLGDVVSALTKAEFAVRWLHEHPQCAWQRLPSMERGDDGWWRLPPPNDRLPLAFSILAARVGRGS